MQPSCELGVYINAHFVGQVVARGKQALEQPRARRKGGKRHTYAHIVVGPVRDRDRVTGLDGPGADHSQVRAGAAVRTEALGPPHYPHTGGEGLTGGAGLPKKLFLTANCAAFPENLIEAELFGSEKGAFTGATSSRKGIFELAEGGTLVLDEIGSMPIHLQSKLLGVLEEKRIRRVGGEAIKRINVRIIAACNNDLEEAIKNKTFRDDLYYRLSVIRIHIPPLRARKQDIPKLCEYFIGKMSRDAKIRLTDSELAKLIEYEWPGNVRELKNVIERSLIIQRGQTLKPSLLLRSGHSTSFTAMDGDAGPADEVETIETMEKKCIDRALRKYSGNYSQTAKALGISLSTLKRKVKYYHIAVSG